MTPDEQGISVVICTYNGRERILPTLLSIINQDLHPASFELVVVDNASQDNTLEFCEKILSQSSQNFQWRIVKELAPGLNNARLKGLKEARFDIVLFCDDDNSLSENYLKIGLNVMSTNLRIGTLGGQGIPSFEGLKPEWFDRYSHSFAVGPQSAKDGKLEAFPAALYGAGTFFLKNVLLNYFDRGFTTVMSDRKGMSLSSGGDVELCYLVQLAGYEVWYDHRLTFIHAMPPERMKWNYYLRLKEGIALGECRLLPYVVLLKNRKAGLISFELEWTSLTLLSFAVYCKNKFRTLLTTSPPTPEYELALMVLRAKMISYWRNGANAFRHFHYLKNTL